MKKLELYWSFRSPYSYLVTERVRALASEFNLDAQLKIVRPLALRESDFFERARPQFLPYLLRDVMREGAVLGLPIMPPRPDPVDMDMDSGKVAEAQPLMDLLLGLGFAAVAAGSGLAFADMIAREVWGGTENWHERDVLARATEKAGLDLADLEKWVKENGDQIPAFITENETAQMQHHWGVPLMVLDGEPFFGQDRVAALRWRLEQG